MCVVDQRLGFVRDLGAALVASGSRDGALGRQQCGEPVTLLAQEREERRAGGGVQAARALVTVVDEPGARRTRAG